MNIDRDKLIEIARKAGFMITENGTIFRSADTSCNNLLAKFASLVSAHAITSMQTEQPVAYAISAELKNTFKSGKRLENSLDDYWNAPSGVGELASQWSDKPHRLLYDLISASIYQPTSLSANEQHTHHAPVTSMQGDSEPVALIALKSAEFQKRIALLEDLLASAYNIANRNGENTQWQRFAGQLHINGISPITPKTFKILPSDADDRVKGVSDANKDADNIGLIASREIMNILVDAGVILFTSKKPQLQAKIQCAVIKEMEKVMTNAAESIKTGFDELTREEIIAIAEKAGAYVGNNYPQLIEGNHQVKVFEYTKKVIESVRSTNSDGWVLTLIDDDENRTYKFYSLKNALIAQQDWLEQGIKSTIQPAEQSQELTVIPKGYALVPLQLTKEMELVLEDEWQWEDLLAAANAITEEQYQQASKLGEG